MSSGVFEKLEFGIIPGSTWHTAVSLANEALIKVNSVGPLNPQIDLVFDESAGMYHPQYADRGRRNYELNFTGAMRYENSEWVHIVQLIGNDTKTGASDPYTHTIDLDDEVTYFYTAGAIVDDQVYEWPSVQPTSFELATGADGFMTFSCTGIADQIKIAGDATNDSSTFTASAYDTKQLRVPFGHCRVNLNAQDGADFDSSGDGTDRIYPTAVTISFSRPYVADFLADRTTSNSQEWLTAQPQPNGMPECILTLEFPELDTDNYLEFFQDQGMKKAEVYFYSTANRNIKFQFPNLQPLQPDVSPDGAGRIPQVVSFRAMEAQSNPIGMAFSKPFRLTIMNSYDHQYHNVT